MIGANMYTTIITLHKLGHSDREIQRRTNINRKSIGKIIKNIRKKILQNQNLTNVIQKFLSGMNK